MLFADEHGCRDDEILREHRRGRRRHVARKNGEIERAGFLQPTRSRGEAKPARESGFGGRFFHVDRFAAASKDAPFRGISAALPEAASGPPRGMRRNGICLRLVCS